MRQLSDAVGGFDAGATTGAVLVPPEVVKLDEGVELDEENGFFNKDDVSAAPTLLMQNMQQTKVQSSIAATYRVFLCVVIMIKLLSMGFYIITSGTCA